MMLAAPPAAAMTYVNDSMGLDPSVYGGGGSPSSDPFPDDSPFFSRESSALVSTTTEDVAGEVCVGYSSKGGAGAVAVRDSTCGSVTEGLEGSYSPSGVA